MVSMIDLAKLDDSRKIQSTQEIACPCEYSEVLHKQVGTQIVSL